MTEAHQLRSAGSPVAHESAAPGQPNLETPGKSAVRLVSVEQVSPGAAPKIGIPLANEGRVAPAQGADSGQRREKDLPERRPADASSGTGEAFVVDALIRGSRVTEE